MPDRTPTIDMNPTSGPVGTGIDIRGEHFDAAGQDGNVTFNGTVVGAFRVAKNKTLNAYCQVPPNSPAGDASVVIAAGDQSASATFTVTA